MIILILTIYFNQLFFIKSYNKSHKKISCVNCHFLFIIMSNDIKILYQLFKLCQRDTTFMICSTIYTINLCQLAF